MKKNPNSTLRNWKTYPIWFRPTVASAAAPWSLLYSFFFSFGNDASVDAKYQRIHSAIIGVIPFQAHFEPRVGLNPNDHTLHYVICQIDRMTWNGIGNDCGYLRDSVKHLDRIGLLFLSWPDAKISFATVCVASTHFIATVGWKWALLNQRRRHFVKLPPKSDSLCRWYHLTISLALRMPAVIQWMIIYNVSNFDPHTHTHTHRGISILVFICNCRFFLYAIHSAHDTCTD